MQRFLSKKYRKVPPTELVTVRRWHRSAAAEGIWGRLTKCGVTESMTDRRIHYGPSCWFIMKIREVVQYQNFKNSNFLKRRPSTDRCSYDDLSYLLSRVTKRAAKEIAQLLDDGVHDGPW
ncbi:hypothetical protein EJD97_007720 [Solanum chilense]|uniref:Uncharacterized protein n=1 Tax=Solanum chilense TaxID=4083 RepID=A0A6N2BTY5_SOLCI|nr:hypothetical protein EJD97_007720 [Solanum chilense]